MHEPETVLTTTHSLPKRRASRRRLWALPLLVPTILIGYVCLTSYQNTITPQGIIIHHSARTYTPGGVLMDIRIINSEHHRRGFGVNYWGRTYYVGYHYVILPDGRVQTGRPEHCRGAHAVGFNNYIGICLIGDFSSKDNPGGEQELEEPTPAQQAALLELSRRLRAKYHIPLNRVRGHFDVNPQTECPGNRFPMTDFLTQLNETHPPDQP